MALIKSVRGFTPQIGENCYLADNATIIGDVITVLISKPEAYYILFIRNR